MPNDPFPPPPGEREEEEEEASGAPSIKGLSDVVGLSVFAVDGNFYTIELAPGVKADRRLGFNYPNAGLMLRNQNTNALRPFVPGQYATASGSHIFQIGANGLIMPGTERSLTQSERNSLFGTGGGGGGGGGGGVGRTQFASEEALDRAQAERLAAQTGIDLQQLQIDRDTLSASIASDEANLAWLREKLATEETGLDRRQREMIDAEMRMLEKRLDNSRRELAFSMGMQERSTLIQEKAATGRELMKVGPDPFRQAAILGGGLQRGTTPQQAVVGQAQAFMQQPLPQISMGMSLPQLEQSIAQMQTQGMQQPQFGGFGMARGGVIEMENKDGAFSKKPSQRETYLVGDGAGIIPGVTEALTVEKGPFGIKSVEVTPLAGMAQGGMYAGGTMNPLQSSVFQALQPLYQGMGFGAIPTRTMLGATGETVTGNFGALSQLGVQPQFVRDVVTGEIWRITGNTRQHITSPEVMAGIHPSDVVGAMGSEIARMAPIVGTPLSALPSMQEIPSGPSGYGALPTPLIEATTGALLPAIHRRAGLLGRWQQERPELFANALSAYGNVLDPVTGGPFGGISPDVIQSQIAQFRPQGRTWNPQRIGFTGARY